MAMSRSSPPPASDSPESFFSGRGRRLGLTPLGRADAVARLVASSFPPFYSAAGLDFTLGLLDEVTRTVPCHELSFPPDSTAVDFVRQQTP